MLNRISTASFLLFCALTSFAAVAGAPSGTDAAWRDLDAAVVSLRASRDGDAELPRVAEAARALSSDPAHAEGAASVQAAAEEALRAWKAPGRVGYDAAQEALLTAYDSLRGRAAASAAAPSVPVVPAFGQDKDTPAGAQLDRLFGERARGDAGAVGGATAPGPGAASGAAPGVVTTAAPRRRGLDESTIGALGGEAAAPADLAGARGELARLQTVEAALSALPSVPLIEAATAGPLADARAGRSLLEASLASRDWLERGGASAELKADLERALALPPDRRAAALAALQGRVDAAFDSSPSAQAEAALRERMTAARTPEEAASAALELREFGRAERDYLQARGAWAQFVAASREKLSRAPEGTAFTQEALGVDLGATGPVTKSSREGAPGVEYRAADGLLRFHSLDGQVTGSELRGAKGSAFVVTDRRDGKLVLTTYDEQGRKLDAERFEPQPDGRVSWTLDSAPWPRALGRMDAQGRFVADEYRNEDGSGRVAAGAEMPGAWVLKDKAGAVAGRTLDLGAMAGEKDPGARTAKAAAAAKWLVAQVQPGETGEPLRFRDSVTSLLEDYLSRSRGSASFFMGADRQITITEEIPGGGVSQLVAKMEPSVSGRAFKGLKVYTRRAESADATTPFIPVMQYFGRDLAESFTSRVDSNSDSWSWWLTGITVTDTKIVHTNRRRVRDGVVSWVEDASKLKELPPETIFEASGIVGQTGQAIAVVGKGAADLTGSAVAVGLAHSPGYLALVKMTGGDAGAAYDDLLKRAKVNFFDNAISRELGDNLMGQRYREGKEALGLDSSVAVQNVGQEMRAKGHDTLGGVLQGGVSFSNNTVLFLGGAGALNGVAKLGYSGRALAAGAGVGMSGVGGYHLGSAINETAHAAASYDASDPASRDRWYHAVAGMSEQSLNAPMLFGVALKGLRGPAGPAAEPKMPSWMPARVAAGDARLGGWLTNTPLAGAWLARELGLRPAGPRKAAEPVPEPAAEPVAKAAAEPVSPPAAEPAAAIRQAYGKAGEPHAQAYEMAARELGADAQGIAGRSSFAQNTARIGVWPKEIVVNGKSEPFTFQDAVMLDKVPASMSAENVARLPARTQALIALKRSMGKLPSDVDIVSPVTDEVRLTAMRKAIFEKTGVLVEVVPPEIPVPLAPAAPRAPAPPAVDAAANSKLLSEAAAVRQRTSMQDPPPEWTAGDAGRPRVQLVREVSAEGSSGIVFEGRLDGRAVAVKTFTAPLNNEPWAGHQWQYFKTEIANYRAMESALPKGSVPKMHGEVEVGGNPSFATDLVYGKDPTNLTVAEARLIPPEAVRQAAAAVEALAARNLGGMDSPQPMILTRAQVINGVPRKAGDIIFMDAGALSASKSIWQTPADLAGQVARVRTAALQARPGEELLTIEQLYGTMGRERFDAMRAAAQAAADQAAASAASR